MEVILSGQITEELISYGWDFDFYSNCNGKPLACFEQVSGIAFLFEKDRFVYSPQTQKQKHGDWRDDEIQKELISKFSSWKVMVGSKVIIYFESKPDSIY